MLSKRMFEMKECKFKERKIMQMFVKIKAEKYEKLKSFFKGPEFIRASAVIYSNRDGDVFVDNEDEPNIAFVNTSNFSYLSGGLSSLKKLDDFKTFFNDLFEKDK